MSGTGRYNYPYKSLNWIILHEPDDSYTAFPEYEKVKHIIRKTDYLELIGEIMEFTDDYEKRIIENPKFLIEDNNG